MKRHDKGRYHKQLFVHFPKYVVSFFYPSHFWPPLSLPTNSGTCQITTSLAPSLPLWPPLSPQPHLTASCEYNCTPPHSTYTPLHHSTFLTTLPQNSALHFSSEKRLFFQCEPHFYACFRFSLSHPCTELTSYTPSPPASYLATLL